MWCTIRGVETEIWRKVKYIVLQLSIHELAQPTILYLTTPSLFSTFTLDIEDFSRVRRN